MTYQRSFATRTAANRRRAVLLIPVVLTTVLCACQTTGRTDMEDIAFRASTDHSEQRFVLLRPDGRRDRHPRDVLIALHGHGSDRWQFARDPRDECSAARQLACTHGMLYVCPDYRAATSWMGPAAEADMLDVIAYLKRHCNTKRLFVCGGSMGGTAALIFAVRHPDLVDGVTAMNGTANLVEYGNFLDFIAASYGGAKDEVPHEYRERSAEFFPHRLTMPVAMTTGGRDDVVPPDSVIRLHEALRRQGTPTLLLHRPEGGHATGFSDAMSALEFMLEKAKSKRSKNRPESG